MAKQTINNGEAGSSVRSKLNANFTELYGGQVFVGLTSNGNNLLHRGSTAGVCIGDAAGAANSTAVSIGFQAGAGATAVEQSFATFVGRHAGFAAVGSDHVCVGHAAAQYARQCGSSVVIGYEAARNPNQLATFNCFEGVYIGHNAGRQAMACQTAVIIGSGAGANNSGNASCDSVAAVVIGYAAAGNATACRSSVIVGDNAGLNCASSYSVYLGAYAGYSAQYGNNIMIGFQAGMNLDNWKRLVIEGDPTFGQAGTTALIYGEFDNRILDFNGSITWRPKATATPADNGDLTFEATSNTSLQIKYKGSDGVVRAATLTLS